MSLAIRGVKSFSQIASHLQSGVSQEVVAPTQNMSVGVASTALSTRRAFSTTRSAYRNGEHVSRAFLPPTPLFLSMIPKAREIFQRGMATKIESPLRGEAFFNREKEIEALTSILNGKPQLSIVSGPVDSGKTALMLHMLEKLSTENKRPILYLDLRDRSFSSVDTFHSALEEEMGDWLKKFQNIAKQFKLKFDALDFGLEASVENSRIDPLSKLNSLFKIMSDQLPSWTWWGGPQSPILFIDEANKLNMLLKDPQGHEALENLFEWFVAHTKQKQHFHVVLAASDSFFHLWVQKFIGSSRIKSYVIGNLTKQEAQQFWMSRAVTPLKLPEERASGLFEDAYQVCGGNMFSLENYVAEYSRSKGQLRPTGFSLVRAERAKLTNALFRSGNGPASSHTENGEAVWTREQFVTMMKKLTESKSGFLVYNNLCEEMGQKVVDAFIAYNLLHLRPSKDFAYDLPEAPEDLSIVTAETPSSLVAMRRVLEGLKNV